ncbi:MAG: hypothetical protein E7596_03685 [Ruminococcaceae bacterium]|nr:hypothetical protein [Oscillospiraceae bacterium]
MLKLLIIAAIFWFNPLVSNIDILPDIIGYLLVIKAFSRASYIYGFVDDVYTSAKKMCIITGAKIFSMLLVSSFDPTLSLLMSFCFGLLEVIFGIPFLIKLFNAYSHLASLDNTSVGVSDSRIKTFTIVAFASRLVLAMLPDLTALSLNNALSINADYTYLRFRPLFIGFSVIVALVINIIWLVKYISYLRNAITKDTENKCSFEYSEKTSTKKSVFVAKDNMRAVIFTMLGSVFIFDFTWEHTYVDIFQDFMFPVITALALGYLFFKGIYKLNKMSFLLLGVTVVNIALNIFEIVSNTGYFEKYNLASMLKVSEAESLYFLVCVSAVLSALSLVATCAVIAMVMKSNARTSILEHKDLFSQSDIDYYLKEFDRRTKKNALIVVALSSVYAVENSLMVILKPYAEWMVLVNMVIEIALIISIISFALYIYDEVYKRILTFS